MLSCADLGTVHDHRVHADQHVAADAAAVQHRAVADMAVLLDDRVGVGEAVHDAGVLEVRTLAQLQPAEIAAQAGGRADIAAGADDHVADQDRGRMDEGSGVDDRDQAVDGVYLGHAQCRCFCTRVSTSYWAQTRPSWLVTVQSQRTSP